MTIAPVPAAQLTFDSRCLHVPGPSSDPTGAVSTPIYQSATFAHPGVGQSTGYDYSRTANPTREALERTVASLEGGTAAFAFSSGMAAIAAVLELLKPGDHLITSADLYGGTHRLLTQITQKNGVSVTQAASLDAIGRAVRPDTAAIFIETPTNPTMQVIDIAAVAGLARRADALFIVDNTFLTPYFQRPLELGADIVVHSATKFLGGHNDTLAGIAVVADTGLEERLFQLSQTIGSVLAPFDSWLIARGIKTLAVRLERQSTTAAALAGWLEAHPKVTAVHYPGLASHPGHALCARQATGFGAMVAFEVPDAQVAQSVLQRVQTIAFAESLGGVESLITYPAQQTHADVPVAQRAALGITDRLLRLSVGLESTVDLIDDLAQALEG
jgi:cystathionine beta-lyase/cystathionine gamma-synthase